MMHPIQPIRPLPSVRFGTMTPKPHSRLHQLTLGNHPHVRTGLSLGAMLLSFILHWQCDTAPIGVSRNMLEQSATDLEAHTQHTPKAPTTVDKQFVEHLALINTIFKQELQRNNRTSPSTQLLMRTLNRALHQHSTAGLNPKSEAALRTLFEETQQTNAWQDHGTLYKKALTCLRPTLEEELHASPETLLQLDHHVSQTHQAATQVSRQMERQGTYDMMSAWAVFLTFLLSIATAAASLATRKKVTLPSKPIQPHD